MDLQYPVYNRAPIAVGPTRFEYDLDDILARIPIDELRYGVLDGLVVVEKLGFLENLAAGRAGEDVVPQGKEKVISG